MSDHARRADPEDLACAPCLAVRVDQLQARFGDEPPGDVGRRYRSVADVDSVRARDVITRVEDIAKVWPVAATQHTKEVVRDTAPGCEGSLGARCSNRDSENEPVLLQLHVDTARQRLRWLSQVMRTNGTPDNGDQVTPRRCVRRLLWPFIDTRDNGLGHDRNLLLTSTRMGRVTLRGHDSDLPTRIRAARIREAASPHPGLPVPRDEGARLPCIAEGCECQP
jgi:hypothetical protein